MTPTSPTDAASTLNAHKAAMQHPASGKAPIKCELHHLQNFHAMRPVAIFRHSPTEDSGYFAIFLEARRIPWTLIALDAGDAVPVNAQAYSGLCFMGGAMSVNDPLSWIAPVCALIRDAVAQNIPVLGHCLGGQLISKALGGTVTKNPVKEIGWSQIAGCADEVAQRWLGDFAGQSLTVFQWHGETFSLPEHAILLAENAACAHQIFALGPHLAMQCHTEMLPEMIANWCEQWQEEAAAIAHLPSVQTPEAMQADLPQNLPALRKLADQLYGVWVEGLREKRHDTIFNLNQNARP
ncbi:MAG: type 1 glutamine amidotransferase [Zoogloeaceae bacterium]|nr:type 1 glutamine amidotransferase [Zoogloeaceae bacterium]